MRIPLPPMGIIARYALSTVIFIYVISLLLFVFALQLVEIVTNLVQYIQLSTPLEIVLRLQTLYLPVSIHFALPIAMLFAVSFSMGNFYSTNELLAVFSAGVSLRLFSLPILLFAAVISLSSFFLEEFFVVGARAKYNSLRESTLLINSAADNEFVAIFGNDGNDVYYAEFYDTSADTLVQPTFIERDFQGVITRRISARNAVWDGEYWVLENAHSYVWNADSGEVDHVEHGRARLTNISVTPEAFANAELNIDEMTLSQARDYIVARRRSGLPFAEELTVYYKRFAFSCTALMVALISCSVGGLLRRHTLLLSMLLALCATILYYVLSLVVDLLSFNGYIPAAFAAWLPVFLFFGGGIGLRRLIKS